MATATETYTFTSFGAELKAYLGVSGDTENTNLELWLSAAAQDCDDFVKGETWIDDDGEDVTHSPLIKLGVFEWVKAFREWYQRKSPTGVSEKQTGPLRERYIGGVSGVVAIQLARMAAIGFWVASVKDISLLGKGY